MAPSQQQDSFIDDSDELWYLLPFHSPLSSLVPQFSNVCRVVQCGTCQNSGQKLTNLILPHVFSLLVQSPLCVEEFDLSDKNFKPCPCGYQVMFPPPRVAG